MDPEKSVEHVTSALKDTPALLALVILNVAMGTLIAFLIVRSADARFKERAEIINLLSRCIQDSDVVKSKP